MHLCNVVTNDSLKCVNNTEMLQSVSGMRTAHGLMHKRSQDFGLGGGLNRESHAMTSSEIFKKRDFYGTKNEKSKAGSLL